MLDMSLPRHMVAPDFTRTGSKRAMTTGTTADRILGITRGDERERALCLACSSRAVRLNITRSRRAGTRKLMLSRGVTLCSGSLIQKTNRQALLEQPWRTSKPAFATGESRRRAMTMPL